MQLKIFFIVLCMTFVLFNLWLLSEEKNLKTKKDCITYLMNSRENSLTILENRDHPTGKGDTQLTRIIFDSLDLTSLIEKLIGKKTITFATGKLLIFDGQQVVWSGKDNLWACSAGIIFIPGKTGISIIHGTNIRYYEKPKIISAAVQKYFLYNPDTGTQTEISDQKQISLEVN